MIYADGVMSVDFCPAFNAWPDGWLTVNQGFFFNPANECTADNTLMNKFIAFFQFSLCIPLCHSALVPVPQGDLSMALSP